MAISKTRIAPGIEYPINPDTGNPTFRERRLQSVVVERVFIQPPMIAAEGFPLQSVASLVYRDFRRWYEIAELSRLLHPAEFDLNSEILIPSTTEGTAGE